MLSMTACISKICLETYIFFFISVNIDNRYITKNGITLVGVWDYTGTPKYEFGRAEFASGGPIGPHTKIILDHIKPFPSLTKSNIRLEKERDRTQSFDKTPYIHRKIQKSTWQHKTPPKTSITQQMRTDLGRSIEVTTTTQLFRWNRLTDSQPPHLQQKLCNQKDKH